MRRSARTTAACGLTVLLFLASCGSDDDTTDASKPASPSGGDETPTADDVSAYCDAALAVEIAFGAMPDESTAEDLAPVAPLVDRVVELSPDEVAGNYAILADVFATVSETGDFSAFETPEVAAANDANHAFDLENCDFTRVDVTASDYLFDAEFPTTAGQYSFEMANIGAEPHVAIVASLKTGETGTAEEAFDAVAAAPDPEAEFNARFDEVAGTFIHPDEDSFQYYDLAAGDYVIFCPVSVGSTLDAEGDGPPHFAEGMLDFFTIR